jgi:hypothetical protein
MPSGPSPDSGKRLPLWLSTTTPDGSDPEGSHRKPLCGFSDDELGVHRLTSQTPLKEGCSMTADTLIVTDYPPLPEQQLPAIPDLLPDTPHKPAEVGVDVTAALRCALQDVPHKGVIAGATADRSDRATTILFPGLPRGSTYLLTEPVTIPGDRNIRLAATTPRGARLRSAEGMPHGLISGSGHRVHVFENLVFHRGGVLLAGDARGVTNFLSCSFHGIDTPPDTPPEGPSAWAIQTGGPGSSASGSSTASSPR